MPKYLGMSKFTPEGLRSFRAAGAASRVAATRAGIEAMGGRVEAVYFAFGEWDSYGVLDLPSDEAAAALSLAISEGGIAVTRTVKLLTPEQLDAALQINVGYRPPGQ